MQDVILGCSMSVRDVQLSTLVARDRGANADRQVKYNKVLQENHFATTETLYLTMTMLCLSHVLYRKAVAAERRGHNSRSSAYRLP